MRQAHILPPSAYDVPTVDILCLLCNVHTCWDFIVSSPPPSSSPLSSSSSPSSASSAVMGTNELYALSSVSCQVSVARLIVSPCDALSPFTFSIVLVCLWVFFC